MIPDFPALTDHIYIWIFGIILPFLSGLQSHQLSGSIKFDSQLRRKLYLSNSLMLSLAGGSVLLMWLFKKRSLTSLGFSLPDWDKYVLIILLLFVFISLYLADLFISSRKQENSSNEAEWYEKSSFCLKNGKKYQHLCYYVSVPEFLRKLFTEVLWSIILYRKSQENCFQSLPCWLLQYFSALHIFIRAGHLSLRFFYSPCYSTSFSYRQKVSTPR